jgi:hypothetical protein
MRTSAAAALLLSLLTFPLVAGEGMWMPEQVPQLATELKAMGLELDPAALAQLTGHPMGAIVSLGGCSASFVSPQGLVVTNHHCVDGFLQFNSSAERDLLEHGFLARSLDEEIQASPEARVYVTRSIEDVTQQIVIGVARLPVGERVVAIERRQKEMIRQCEAEGGVRCLVASFYEDSQFFRLIQTEIRDVRLVYAPARSIGNFGGEIDNWMWPRHTGDFGFLRAYVGPDGKPADFSAQNVPYRPAHHLKVSTSDIDPGDLMIVAGYPGRTFRYRLAHEVAQAEAFTLPTSIRYRELLIDVLQRESRRDRQTAIRNAGRIRGLQNILKKFEGTLTSFSATQLVAQRTAEEEKRAKADPSFRKTIDEIAKLNERVWRTRERDTVYGWLYDASPMLRQSDMLYVLSRERAKKDAERQLGYQQRDWPRLRASIARQQRVIDPATDRAGLRAFLLEAAALPAEQRIPAVDQALAATGAPAVEAQVDAFLDRLYAGTGVSEQQVRASMFEETTETLNRRGDTMIAFAAALRQLGDANQQRDREIRGAMLPLRPRYVEGLKQLRGRIYPDANGTLRVSFGAVEGYVPRDSVTYAAQTSVKGLLEKESGRPPFDNPTPLLDAIRAGRLGPYVDPELGTVPVAFISSGDITNGSSGSATLNARGELAGLAFDGNYEAMGSDYVVDPTVTRAIHVDSRYMLWVMDAVDGAHNLLREMSLPVHFPEE